jgi:4-hydroxy-tetrahydrodipicolinate synthase
MSHQPPTDPRFRGVFSLLLTPFLADKSIDWTAYDRHAAWQLEQGPAGLFAVCGSSEMKWLEAEERISLARRAVELAGGVPVVATANLLPDAARHPDEIRRMADTGVAAVVLVPPPGMGENQDQLGEYFARLIDLSPCPSLIYEWPMVKPYLIDARIYGELVRDHGLAGIKDTTCTMEGISGKIQVTGPATVFQANAPYFAEAIRAGAGGIMAITTTAAGDVAVSYWREESQGVGLSERARVLHELLVLLDCAMVRGDAYPATAKHLAALRGPAMESVCRHPAVLTREGKKAVEVWLRHAQRDGIPARPAGGSSARGSS